MTGADNQVVLLKKVLSAYPLAKPTLGYKHFNYLYLGVDILGYLKNCFKNEEEYNRNIMDFTTLLRQDKIKMCKNCSNLAHVEAGKKCTVKAMCSLCSKEHPTGECKKRVKFCTLCEQAHLSSECTAKCKVCGLSHVALLTKVPNSNKPLKDQLSEWCAAALSQHWPLAPMIAMLQRLAQNIPKAIKHPQPNQTPKIPNQPKSLKGGSGRKGRKGRGGGQSGRGDSHRGAEKSKPDKKNEDIDAEMA